MGIFSTLIIGFIIFKIWSAIFSDKPEEENNGAFGDENPEEDFSGAHLWEKYFFRCLGKLAKADGSVGREEAAFVKELFKQFRYSPETCREMGRQFNYGRDTEREFSELLADLRRVLISEAVSKTLIRGIVQTFCAIVAVDHKIHPREREMLETAGRFLGAEDVVRKFFDGDDFDGRGRSRRNYSGGNENYSASRKDPYSILGVDSAVSDSEIKKAYRKKMLEFHPDQVQGRGLSEAYIEFAKQKSQEINDAYDEIKRERGIK